MIPLRELLASDHRQALEFFFLGLLDVSEPTVDRQELLYNASVLAHYAQVSTQASVDVPAPANLSAVFDCFVFDNGVPHDGLMLETAGAQCLLMAGFFEDQMRRRYARDIDSGSQLRYGGCDSVRRTQQRPGRDEYLHR